MEQRKQIYEMRKAGKPLKEIGYIFNITEASICRYAKNYEKDKENR